MIELKKEDARKKIFQAYEEKRLSAQNGSDRCRYRDTDGHPCAIGVLLDEDTAEDFDAYEDSAVGDLIYHEQIITDDDDWFTSVQRAHDQWLLAVVMNPISDRLPDFIEEQEQLFIEALKS